MWLFESGELYIRVQPQPVIQVRRATLWLTNDIEIRKAPHAVQFSVAVNQVFSESVPQVLKHRAEAPRVVCIQVCPVRVRSDIPSVFLIPTGVLDTRQVFAGDNREHLKRQRKQSALNYRVTALPKTLQTKPSVAYRLGIITSKAAQWKMNTFQSFHRSIKPRGLFKELKICGLLLWQTPSVWDPTSYSRQVCRRIQSLEGLTCRKLSAHIDKRCSQKIFRNCHFFVVLTRELQRLLI